MEREIIKLTEFNIAPILCEYAIEQDHYDHLYDENGDLKEHQVWCDYEVIDSTVDYYDLEEAYQKLEVIVKRKSDGKYFRGYWTQDHWMGNEYETELVEVFPRKIEKIIYE